MLWVRVASERAGDVVGLFRSRDRLEVLERMARESIEVREFAQLLALPLCLLREPALAMDQPAEIGVSNRNLHAHPARVFADGTAPCWGRRGRAVAAGRTDRDREGGEDVADAFHEISRCPALTVPLARFSSRGLPAFQNALDVAPGALVIGDRFRDRIFDPFDRPCLQCPHEMVGNERCERTDVLLVETKDIRPFRDDGRRLSLTPECL